MTEQELLETTVQVYDMEEVIPELSGKKYSPHIQHKIAVIKDKGSDMIAWGDYEAIGNDGKADDKHLFNIEIEDYYDPKVQRKSFPIFGIGFAHFDLAELEKFKPIQEVKAKDFFTKRDYNPRCQHNWYLLVKAVKDFK